MPYTTKVDESERSKYDVFPPFFGNSYVTQEHYSDYMKEFIQKNNLSTEPRRLLLSGMRCIKTLFCSELLAWYLEKNFKITRVYKCIEFVDRAPFEKFVKLATENRIAADKEASKYEGTDPLKAKAILDSKGSAWKLLTNSGR